MEGLGALKAGRWALDQAGLTTIEDLARYARQQGNLLADDLLAELLAVLSDKEGTQVNEGNKRRDADPARQGCHIQGPSRRGLARRYGRSRRMALIRSASTRDH